MALDLACVVARKNIKFTELATYYTRVQLFKDSRKLFENVPVNCVKNKCG